MVGRKAGVLVPLLALGGCCLNTTTGQQITVGATSAGMAKSAGSTGTSTGGTSGSSSGGTTSVGSSSNTTGATLACGLAHDSNLNAYATYDPLVLVSLASTDLNGDGMLDLFAWQLQSGSENQTFDIFFGQPDGGLRAPVSYPGEGFFGFGDLNGDGYPDVAVASGTSAGVLIYFNDGGGGLLQRGAVTTAQSVFSIGIGDVNGDGFADLVFGEDGFPPSAEIAFGDNSGLFSTPVALPGLGYPLVVADFNGDGLADIAASTADETQLAVLLSQGDGGFQTTFYATALGTMALLPHPSGPPDLVLGDTGQSDGGLGIRVLTNLGDGTFTLGPGMQVSGAIFVAIGDFNADCIPDIATSWSATCADWQASVFYGDGDGGFAPAVSWPTIGYVGSLAALGPVGDPRALAASTEGGCFDAGIAVYGDASRP